MALGGELNAVDATCGGCVMQAAMMDEAEAAAHVCGCVKTYVDAGGDADPNYAASCEAGAGGDDSGAGSGEGDGAGSGEGSADGAGSGEGAGAGSGEAEEEEAAA